jgi:hypothetical protein
LEKDERIDDLHKLKVRFFCSLHLMNYRTITDLVNELGVYFIDLLLKWPSGLAFSVIYRCQAEYNFLCSIYKEVNCYCKL